jgi:CheY-like chemotaxis protein
MDAEVLEIPLTRDVLLVEDDAGDTLMVAEALAEISVRLHVVGDGAEALAFLRRAGEHAGAPRPSLILLDLNLPRVDGREVLAQIKADEALSAIPVVVLTSSEAETDVSASYRRHASAYVTKPLTADAFAGTVRRIGTFYTDVARLPASDNPG